jgi:hypothetical protein
MQKMQEQFSAKEKYPKEIRPMPLASCAPSFLPRPFGLFPTKTSVLGAA